MAYSQILFDVSEGIATITLNRPDALTAWTATMGGEIREAMAAAEADKEVRAIVLTGAGRGFCAGADMNDLADISAVGETKSRPVEAFDPDSRADFHHPMTYFPAVKKTLIRARNA